MKEPRITSLAEADLEEVWLYIAQGGEARADQFLDKILKQCRQLAEFPRMGQARENLALNLRSFPVKKYVIFYRPAGDTIDVIRILHGARDIESIFRDNPPAEEQTS